MKTQRQIIFNKLLHTELMMNIEQEHIFDVTDEFHVKHKWRFDYAIVPLKIAIEVEGGVFTRGAHVRGLGYIKDIEKYNRAAALGWQVFRIPAHYIPNKCMAFIQMIKRVACAKV